MGTIAIVACCDTKFHEITFVREQIRSAQHNPLVIDMSTGIKNSVSGDITREEVLRAGGFVPEKVIGHFSKSDSIAAMTSSICTLLPKLCQEKKIDAVIGMGGMQNTLMCSAAFRLLPIGFPKLIVSTVASGYKYFDMVVGTKDITVVPSIVDFCGMNVISEPILTNATASIIGMTQYGGKLINTDGHRIIGATLMGITNDTVVAAEEKLRADGYELLSFHSTGVGGQVMEQMIHDGHISAVMDLSLHEMVPEYFGNYGYCRGATNRLCAGAKAGIPMVISPGGIDCISLTPEEFLPDQEERGYVWHNPSLTHTRLHESEILDVARIIVERLNQAVGEVVVLLPTAGGLRTLSRKGEPFYAPETMQKIRRIFEEGFKPEITLKCFDLNFMDPEFAEIAAEEMELLLEKQAGGNT